MKHIVAITLMNLRSIGARRGASSVVIVGIAGVVAVLVSMLAMSAGFRGALANTGQSDRAIVMRAGSPNEMSSWVSLQEANIVAHLDGVDIASGELYVALDLQRKATGDTAHVVGRGVETEAYDVRPEVVVVRGRRFQPGKNEMLVGTAAAREYANLEIGAQVAMRESTFEVVGHFSAEQSANESEVWMDLTIAQDLFRRGPVVNSMRLRLADPSDAAPLATTIRDDPRLDLTLIPEDEYYAAQSRARASLIDTFAVFVAGIMAVGSLLAALNTMYSAVNARTVEIATLRALGFGSGALVTSVMVEAMVLAAIGGLLGGLVVYLAFDGYTASTLNSASNTQVAFAFAVTPALLQQGMAWALGLGFAGGLLPAVRAARLPITEGLRRR